MYFCSLNLWEFNNYCLRRLYTKKGFFMFSSDCLWMCMSELRCSMCVGFIFIVINLRHNYWLEQNIRFQLRPSWYTRMGLNHWLNVSALLCRLLGCTAWVRRYSEFIYLVCVSLEPTNVGRCSFLSVLCTSFMRLMFLKCPSYLLFRNHLLLICSYQR